MLETSGRNQAISLTGKQEPFLGSDINPHGRCWKQTSIFRSPEKETEAQGGQVSCSRSPSQVVFSSVRIRTPHCLMPARPVADTLHCRVKSRLGLELGLGLWREGGWKKQTHLMRRP